MDLEGVTVDHAGAVDDLGALSDRIRRNRGQAE
jgi:hypothetical protein